MSDTYSTQTNPPASFSDPGALEEAYIRGILPPDRAAAYEEAKSRGLIGSQNYYQNLAKEMPGELAQPNTMGLNALKEAARGIPIAGAAVSQTPEDTQFQQEHPGVTTGARITGAIAGTAPAILAAPELFGLGAAGIGVRSLMGGATNALIGGTDAAVRGQPVAPAALTSAAFGSLVPYGAQVAGYGAGQIGNKIAPLPSDVSSQLSGLNSRALDWAASAAKASGLSEAQIAQKYQELGPNGFVTEYGHNLGKLAQDIHGLPGAGSEEIHSGFTGRAAGAGDRIESIITDAFGPRVNIAELTAQREAARKAATAPLYQQFNSTQVPLTPQLSSILDNPAVKEALPDAAKLASYESKPFLNDQGAPTAQTWDYIKRAMDDKSRAAGFGTNQSRIFGNVSKSITEAIDNHPNPNVAGVWKQARQTFSDAKKVDEATQLGQELFTRPVRSDELAQTISGMSEPEKQGLLQGARDNITRTFDATARGDTAARNMFLAPENQAKANLILGPEKTQALIQKLEQEKTFADSKNAIIGGSQTGPRNTTGSVLRPPGNWVDTLREHMISGPITAALKPLGTMATEDAARAYERSAAQLAPKLMQQGQQGADFARALMQYAQTRPSETINPSTRTLITMLSQGAQRPTQQYMQGK